MYVCVWGGGGGGEGHVYVSISVCLCVSMFVCVCVIMCIHHRIVISSCSLSSFLLSSAHSSYSLCLFDTEYNCS